MQKFAEKFYKSKAWQRSRMAYLKSVGGLCENCLKQGLYNPAEIVHHKVHIDPININDPAVTLAFHNLEALCRKCHGLEHGKIERRFEVDELGRVKVI